MAINRTSTNIIAPRNNDSANVQRRGAELFLFKAGVIISVIFFALTVVDWYM